MFHRSFYRTVEATSVTPFSPRALDRGLAGTLVAMARLGHAPMTPPRGAVEILRGGRFAPVVAQMVEELSKKLIEHGVRLPRFRLLQRHGRMNRQFPRRRATFHLTRRTKQMMKAVMDSKGIRTR